MKAPAHVAVGAAVGWLAVASLRSRGVEVPPEVLLAGPVAAAVGALIPDIDHPRATISRRVPRRLLREAARIAVLVAAVGALSVALGRAGLADEAARAARPLVDLAGWLLLLAVALVGVSLLAAHAFGHRGATHSLAFAGGAGLLVAAACAGVGVSPWFGALFGLGWLSHLVVDALGRGSLRALLWPLVDRR